MPYKKLGLHMFRDWEPDDQHDAEIDRLLVTTSWGDTFVVRSGPGSGDGLDHVIDPNFMPDNLALIPSELRLYRTVPLDWDATKFPWFIFLYDGEMTSGGPRIEMEAVGTGWTRSITTSLTIEEIRPLRKDEISHGDVSDGLRGVTFGEFIVRESVMYDEAIKG